MSEAELRANANASALTTSMPDTKDHRNIAKFLRHRLLTALLATFFCDADAQPMPPACAQYVKAYATCASNVIRYLEISDPAQAEVFKKEQKVNGLEPLVKNLQDAIKKRGALATAEFCSSGNFRKPINDDLQKFTLILVMSQTMEPACLEATTSIR